MKALRILTILLLTAGAATTGRAQGWIEPIHPIPMGSRVTKVRTHVSVNVTGRVATVVVEEWFRNDSPMLGEGDYLYPLPGEAVFSNFSLFQGDEELRGEMMDAARARAIYEEIVRSRRDPALIELAGHGLIRARIFPINRGETRKITLRYTQVMNRAGEALQFRYAAGTPNMRTVRSFQHHGPRRPERQAPLTFVLTADSGAMFNDPFSPTHELVVERTNGTLRVTPESDLTGDFTLFLPLANDLVGITVAAHKPVGEDGYFMITLSPGTAAISPLPRDLTVVLDVSGSMSGTKLAQAKRAIRQLLAGLQPSDRFRLVAFSSGVRQLSEDWTRATPQSINTAQRWLAGLEANGSTNIADALREALRLPSPDDRLPMTLFLTDGLPTVGEQDPEAIALEAERARGRSRVFAFGVGYDVNTYLLDRLSAAGRGSTQYVQPGEDIEGALGRLAAKISHPVLSDLQIANTPVTIEDVYPVHLPDLFAGEELVVFGRYKVADSAARGEVTIRGMRTNATESFATPASFPERSDDNSFIPRLWAARKLGWLTRQLRLSGHSTELVEEIRELALRYGLLSDYTSYLVQEPLQVAARGSGVLMRQDVMAAPAPREATGRSAVQSAARDRQLRELRGEGDLAELERGFADEILSSEEQLVAGRVFRLLDGIWTDARHSDSTRTVSIAPFSDAYFLLLRMAPELKAYLSEFEQVIVAGDNISISIQSDGDSSMSAGDVALLVRSFRGV